MTKSDKIRELRKALDRSSFRSLEFIIHRYLMANAYDRLDGYEKATRHIELCEYYVEVYAGIKPNDLPNSEQFEAVHDETQELTAYLDEKIGFPIDKRPDYDKLVPLFYKEFDRLAKQALRKCAKERK